MYTRVLERNAGECIYIETGVVCWPLSPVSEEHMNLYIVWLPINFSATMLLCRSWCVTVFIWPLIFLFSFHFCWLSESILFVIHYCASPYVAFIPMLTWTCTVITLWWRRAWDKNLFQTVWNIFLIPCAYNVRVRTCIIRYSWRFVLCNVILSVDYFWNLKAHPGELRPSQVFWLCHFHFHCSTVKLLDLRMVIFFVGRHYITLVQTPLTWWEYLSQRHNDRQEDLLELTDVFALLCRICTTMVLDYYSTHPLLDYHALQALD